MPKIQKQTPRTSPTKTKKAFVLALPNRRSGATIAQIAKTTGWRKPQASTASDSGNSVGIGVLRGHRPRSARYPLKPIWSDNAMRIIDRISAWHTADEELRIRRHSVGDNFEQMVFSRSIGRYS